MGSWTWHMSIRSLDFKQTALLSDIFTFKMAFKSLAAVLFTLAAVSAEVKETESGLKVEYISKPDSCDKVARSGDMLSMHYVGTLESGAKFDSSYDRSEPFKFQIGVGQVIKGWEEGVLGMCVGEKRKLIVPPALGYGDQGAGDIIPGGATLYFEVELIDTEEGPTPVNVFKQIDIDADNALSRDEILFERKRLISLTLPLWTLLTTQYK